MSCAGCPGTETLATPVPASAPLLPRPEPRPNPPVPSIVPLGYVAYGGGPAIRQLSLIGQTLPSMENGPVFNIDGSIVNDQPTEIDGYVREGDTFKPLWQFCQRRLMGAAHDPAAGAIQIVSKCIEPIAPTFNQFVTYSDCSACPFRLGLNGERHSP